VTIVFSSGEVSTEVSGEIKARVRRDRVWSWVWGWGFSISSLRGKARGLRLAWLRWWTWGQ